MTEKRNLRFQTARKMHGVPLWKVADACGISEMTLYRRLRKQLEPDEEDRLIDLIERLAEEGDAS